MDDLIREFEEAAASAIKDRNFFPEYATMWHFYNGIAQAHTVDAMRVREAKRRMAEREPAWDLQ